MLGKDQISIVYMYNLHKKQDTRLQFITELKSHTFDRQYLLICLIIKQTSQVNSKKKQKGFLNRIIVINKSVRK